MDHLTIYLWIFGIHSVFAFFATLNILSCPLRAKFQKFYLLILTWGIPYIGSVIILFQTDYELPHKSKVKPTVSSNDPHADVGIFNNSDE